MVKSKTNTAEEEIGGKSGTSMPSVKQTNVLQKERNEMVEISGKTDGANGDALTKPLSNPIRVVHSPCFYNSLNDENWRLSRLRNLCLNARKKAVSENSFNTVYGNTIFQAWENDVDGTIWPICSSPEQPFLGIQGQPSWETLVEHFLKAHSGDWKKAERAIRVSLDRFAPQSSAPFVKTRQLAMCISRCDPISFFSFAQEESSKTWCNRYWDKCNARNPRLLVEQRPIVKFWLISSSILGDPWVDPLTTELPEEFDSLQKLPQEQDEKKRGREGDISAVQDGLAQSTKAPVDPNSPARGGFLEPNLKIVQEIASPPKPQKPFRDGQPDGWDDDGDPKTVTPGGEMNQEKVQRQTLAKSGDSGQWSASDDGQEKRTSSSNKKKSTAPVSSIDLQEFPIRTAKSVAFQSLQQTSGKTQQKTNREKFQSDAEMARKAHQIRMDGIPRKHSKFVCLSVATNWPGEEEADLKLQDIMAQVILNGMAQALEQVPDLMFMPVGDYTFSDKSKWITSAKQANELGTWDKLRIYLDLAWNNGFTFPRQTKTAGDKILRTRIRIAFDSDENLVEPLLDDIFRPTGLGMGIYRSPLQVGNATKIGWLLNYPVGMGREAVERELMRHFQFTVPIALVLVYPTNPGSYNEKWVSGLHKHAWHVYVPLRFAKMVEQDLSIWLTKSTAKRDMPFGSATQFVVDWNFAKSQDQIPVQDLGKDIIQMINTHDTHCHTTEIVKPSFPIHPLVKTYVPFFDKSVSLLRILYSIQCHPTPPTKEEQKDQNPQPEKESEAIGGAEIPSEGKIDDNKATPSEEMKVEVDGVAAEQPEDPKSPDKKKRKDANSSPQPASQPTRTSAPDQQVQKTPDRKKKGKRKRKKVSTPAKTKLSTSQPQPDALVALEIPVTPADKEAIAAAQQAQTPETADQFQARLLLKDAKNFQPSMLFLLILPSEVEGYMIFVVRKKYKALAESILNNLAAFLIYYLELWKDPENERRTLRQWLCKQHIELTTRYGMTWDEHTLSAVSELDKNVEMDIDDNDDWLSALTPATSISSIFKGTVSLNLKLASVKGIDDGATVVSRINEIRRLQQAAQLHAEVVDELVAKEQELQEKDKALDEKDKLIKALQAQLAAQHLGKDSKVKIAKDKETEMDDEESSDDEEGSGEDEDGDMAGEYEAEYLDEDSDSEASNKPDNPDGYAVDDVNEDNTGQHNDQTAQADAGGGSSGSGS